MIALELAASGCRWLFRNGLDKIVILTSSLQKFFKYILCQFHKIEKIIQGMRTVFRRDGLHIGELDALWFVLLRLHSQFEQLVYWRIAPDLQNAQDNANT